ncbi:MAG: hypothetical protein JNL05_10400 [Flavobacteriales bacterium]|nr:hypothetical protein [Flavobacteriales bacterium]
MAALGVFDRVRVEADIQQTEEMIARLTVFRDMERDPVRQQALADDIDQHTQRLATLKFYLSHSHQ